MSGTVEQPTPGNMELNEQQVVDYLKDNGDFLQRHPQLLDYLHIAHASGSAVSLVEKQVGILRERNVELRHKLSSLTTSARDNDQLYLQTRALVLKLLEADSIEDLYRAFMESMTNDFKVEYACMILFSEDSDRGDDCRFDRASSAKEKIGALLRSQTALCGALRKEELHYLFPNASEEGSAAIMPLYRDQQLGLIAVGSSDAGHYDTGMGTLFLTHVALVVERVLPRLMQQ
ncbi:MAG: DUF484 family protein [Halieaceae bacterium]|jgi:uncharacterized protein|nr:DUF484 family protein [Halieaceae bacterium]